MRIELRRVQSVRIIVSQTTVATLYLRGPPLLPRINMLSGGKSLDYVILGKDPNAE